MIFSPLEESSCCEGHFVLLTQIYGCNMWRNNNLRIVIEEKNNKPKVPIIRMKRVLLTWNISSQWAYRPSGTFTLWGVLTSVSKNIDFIHCTVGLEQLTQLIFRPCPRDLTHKHFDSINVGLVRVVQGPVHLLGSMGNKDQEGLEREPK